MGSGKTWLGKQLSALTDLLFIDLDAHIEQQEGVTIAALFKHKDQAQFRVIEKKYLHELIAANSKLILSCGGGTPCFFDNLDFLKKMGTVLWLDPPISVLVNRLQNERDNRPLLNDIHPDQLEDYIRLTLADRSFFYSQAHLHINEPFPDPAAIVKMIQHE